MACNINYNEPLYCVVTGASRGLGRTISVEIARKAQNKLILLLIARSKDGLEETKKLVKQIKENAEVITTCMDLSKPNAEDFKNVITNSLSDFNDTNSSAIIFHNAGQLGRLCKATDLSLTEWRNYFELNVFSTTALNSVFVTEVRKFTLKLTIVNITSLYGRQAGKYVGLYGTGRATRDMYFKIMAEEEPEITILNWSPGMVKTDMTIDALTQLDTLQGTNEKDNILKQILTPEQTIGKMLNTLENNKFKSGDIVDYYD